MMRPDLTSHALSVESEEQTQSRAPSIIVVPLLGDVDLDS